MRRDQLAINSITTRHDDLPAALAAYAGAGFRQVEFHLPLVHDWIGADPGRSPSDVRDLLRADDLTAIGGFELAFEAFSVPETRARNRARQVANAELLDALGGGTLVFGTDGPDQPTLADLDVLAGELRSFGEAIDGLNVVAAVEFNWGPLVKSLASAVRVCEMADRPNVGILFDPAHYHCTATKPEHLDDRAVRWVRHVHLDDMVDKPGEFSHCNHDRALPGDGILPLADLIERIERHGYDGWFSIEMFSADLWALPASDAAARCYQSLLPLCTD